MQRVENPKSGYSILYVRVTGGLLDRDRSAARASRAAYGHTVYRTRVHDTAYSSWHPAAGAKFSYHSYPSSRLQLIVYTVVVYLLQS